MKKIILSLFLTITLTLLLAACSSSDYRSAMEFYNSGAYSMAAEIFSSLGDYKDSPEKFLECKYKYAEQLSARGDLRPALKIYKELGLYEDAQARAEAVETELMYEEYANVFSALASGVWFFEDSSVNAVNVLTFTEESAVFKEIFYDGNGPHITQKESCSYKADDNSITITLADNSELKLEYTLIGNQISLGRDYFSPQQIMDGLNGYWGLRYTSYNDLTGFSTAEHIYYFDHGNVTFESATEAYGSSNGEYYYSGPHEGTYTVGADGLEVEASNEWQFGFVISNGKVAMCRCGKVLSAYKGFKGQNGFSF